MKIVNEIKSYVLPEGAIFEKSISNLTETRAVEAALLKIRRGEF